MYAQIITNSLQVSEHAQANQTCRQNIANFEVIQYRQELSNRDTFLRQAFLSGLNAGAAPFETTHTCYREAPLLGQDLL